MKKLSIVLIIAGVLVIAAPIVGQLYTSYNENKMIDEWLNSDDAQAAEIDNSSQAEAGDAEDSYSQLQDIFSGESQGTDSVQPDTELSPSPNTTNAAIGGDASNTPAKKPVKVIPPKVIGVIKIDKIKVKAPIVEGVTANDLKVGIGHIPGTAGLGELGNSALAGHRSYTFGKFFNRLDELKEGDLVLLITKQGEYKYKIYKKLVVLPEDVSVLKGDKKNSEITLITCTPIYVASHRLIVKARLESKPADAP